MTQSKPHPIGAFAMKLLTREKGSAAFVLTREADLALRDRFSLHFIRADLRPATEELAILAWFLEEKRASPQPAQCIRRILEDASAVLARTGVEDATPHAPNRARVGARGNSGAAASPTTPLRDTRRAR